MTIFKFAKSVGGDEQRVEQWESVDLTSKKIADPDLKKHDKAFEPTSFEKSKIEKAVDDKVQMAGVDYTEELTPNQTAYIAEEENTLPPVPNVRDENEAPVGEVVEKAKKAKTRHNKGYVGFKAVEEAAKEGGAKDPAAVAAAVGRKKYGAKRMAGFAKEGHEEDLEKAKKGSKQKKHKRTSKKGKPFIAGQGDKRFLESVSGEKVKSDKGLEPKVREILQELKKHWSEAVEPMSMLRISQHVLDKLGMDMNIENMKKVSGTIRTIMAKDGGWELHRKNEVGAWDDFEKARKPVHTAKWDRCVKDVKKKGSDVNPYAVCTSSLGDESFLAGHKKEKSFGVTFKSTSRSSIENIAKTVRAELTGTKERVMKKSYGITLTSPSKKLMTRIVKSLKATFGANGIVEMNKSKKAKQGTVLNMVKGTKKSLGEGAGMGGEGVVGVGMGTNNPSWSFKQKQKKAKKRNT